VTGQSIAVNAATNQLSSAFYDLNGNMTSGVGATIAYEDSSLCGGTRLYSSSYSYGRLVSVANGTGTTGAVEHTSLIRSRHRSTASYVFGSSRNPFRPCPRCSV
jgi:hypothetical protein